MIPRPWRVCPHRLSHLSHVGVAAHRQHESAEDLVRNLRQMHHGGARVRVSRLLQRCPGEALQLLLEGAQRPLSIEQDTRLTQAGHVEHSLLWPCHRRTKPCEGTRGDADEMAVAIVIPLVWAGERGRDEVCQIDIAVRRGRAPCMTAGENDRHCLLASKVIYERAQELV